VAAPINGSEGGPDVHSYGTGVLMKNLYGNKIYLNPD